MAKIAVLGPRPDNNLILTKSDGKVWNELRRVIHEDFSTGEFKGHTFLIPIYSKFDLEILSICEQLKYDVEFYVPQEGWGLTGLPFNRTQLVSRMMSPTNVHIHPGMINRLTTMLDESDGIYLLDIIPNFGPMQKHIDGKPIRRVPVEKMAFTSEDELVGQTELIFFEEDMNPTGVNLNAPRKIPHDLSKIEYEKMMKDKSFWNL